MHILILPRGQEWGNPYKSIGTNEQFWFSSHFHLLNVLKFIKTLLLITRAVSYSKDKM